jgi:hypothetical protein
MRGGAAKAEAIPVRGKTLEGKSPGELHVLVGLNRRLEVVDSRVEQSLEDEGCSEGLFIMERSASARCFGTCDGKAEPRRGSKVFQRQEGNGAGNGVRLHGRSKALEGEPHERIWHETRSAGSGRMKAPRG